MIYCNPNAGYYETIFYDSEWIEFFLSLRINICIQNYRGYGKSEGTPSPEVNFKKIILKIYFYKLNK